MSAVPSTLLGRGRTKRRGLTVEQGCDRTGYFGRYHRVGRRERDVSCDLLNLPWYGAGRVKPGEVHRAPPKRLRRLASLPAATLPCCGVPQRAGASWLDSSGAPAPDSSPGRAVSQEQRSSEVQRLVCVSAATPVRVAKIVPRHRRLACSLGRRRRRQILISGRRDRLRSA